MDTETHIDADNQAETSIIGRMTADEGALTNNFNISIRGVSLLKLTNDLKKLIKNTYG